MVSTATPQSLDAEYTYEAAPGGRIKNEDAPIVGAWLEELGGADAQEIVDKAAMPDAPPPVHNYFEWNDGEAATFYRREQAGRLARAVRVKVVARDGEGNNKDLTGPAFYAVRQPDDEVALLEDHGEEPNLGPARRKVYVSFRVVERDEEYKDQVIEDAKRELVARRRKHAASLEMFAKEAPILSDAFDAIARLEEEEEGE